jgi:hypothetical protein
MATLIFTRYPLVAMAAERFDVPAGTRPLDWLAEHYPPPAGAGGPVYHWHAGEMMDADDEASGYLVRPILEGERVVLCVPPAGVELATILITALVTAIISAAITIGISLLFPEPRPSAAAAQDGIGSPSPVYNLRTRQNLARLGEPVPVVYGRVLTAPDLVSQPYSLFYGDRSMFTDLLLCLGHGEFHVEQLLVGESESDAIEGGVEYIVVPPADHGGTFGNLTAISLAAGWSQGFEENVWTSLEVADQRFTNADDVAGFYRVGRTGRQVGRQIIVNVEWPRGLYSTNDSGQPGSTGVNFQLVVWEADETGQAIAGTETYFPLSETSTTGGWINPVRRSYSVDMGRNGAWLVKMWRNSGPPAGRGIDEFFWRSLELVCGHALGPAAYGNTTLVMVRLIADEIARSAERLVRVRCVRKLPILGEGAPIDTASPADAFIDILCNQTYGVRRPLAELDVPRLSELRFLWGPDYQFNAVYTQRTTAWEALGQSIAGVAAAPLPIGPLMSIVQDGIRPARSLLFTEQNIVKNTFKLSYSFEQTGEADGIEIDYVDPLNFAPASTRWPLESLAPDRMTLFGCSDPRQAAQYARLQWQRRQKLRRSVEFSTELEGLIPLPGERVAVAHTLPRWGISGYVVQVYDGGVNIQLDRALPWDELPAPWFMMFRDELGACSAIVEAHRTAAGDQYAELEESPWAAGIDGWRVGLAQENTHFVFGDGARIVKDWTLVALSPKSADAATVGVTCVCYDETVYDGTLDFLANPIPE